MSNPPRSRRAWRAGIALAVGIAFAAVPVAAQASKVNLGTVSPFVVLGGQAVTNTGPSVLNGELGVAPGTSLVGFGLPAVVNGATHNNDAVANIAKNDLTTAYNVAAGQPVAPANDLSTTNLGNRTLTPGAYRYTSDAGLTGPLTLDAQGDPNAQFVFEIGSALTTAPGSSVVLVNGASPCNVYWQVGSSATLDTTTAFQGNLMALSSISLNNAATVYGRLLARNGQISLINNVITAPNCGAGTSGSTGPSGGLTAAQLAGHNGTATFRRVTRSRRNPTAPRASCTAGFRARITGHLVKRVVFSMDRKHLATRTKSPFQVTVRRGSGRHIITARVSFKDSTRTKTMRLRYRACAAQVLAPRRGPSRFTG
jgi:Ice-binding-like